MDKSKNIIVTGGAGLAGQNLVVELKSQGYKNITIFDKNEENLEILKSLHPELPIYQQDITVSGPWEEKFKNCDCLVMLHAQISGLSYDIFEKNNIEATSHLIDLVKKYNVPYTVHISSSVVVSKSDDFYTRSKKDQEEVVIKSGIKHCILRPTLMFGWFDPKHLGWLARLMEKVPFFPIPGDGKFLRQPLYVRDFVRAIIKCIETEPQGDIYDLVGPDEIDYVDIIKEIKKTRGLKTVIFHIPYNLFKTSLKLAALVMKKPPFTAQQLDALSAGDYFTGVDIEKTFGFKPTHFLDALKETWSHPKYSRIVLRSPH